MVPTDHRIPKTHETHKKSLLLEAESHEHDDQSEQDHQSSSSHRQAKKWSTHTTESPELPTNLPDNRQMALWTSPDHHQIYGQQPYIVFSPLEKRSSHNPLKPVIHMFSSWGRKAETIVGNIWNNLKTGPSVLEAAWGKVHLKAKAITEGGFEVLFKQMFETDPWENLIKRFACYLSTTSGPVAGTLYVSTARLAFCSDFPLSFTSSSGQETSSYYKVVVPWRKIHEIQQVTMGDKNPHEKYVQIVTVDSHHFWFMGFVNFEKALQHLLTSRPDLIRV